MAERAGVGFRCHSGWAVMVVVSGSIAKPTIVDRQRVELIDDSLPRQPYHAVAEDGLPRGVIDKAMAAAAKHATRAVQSLGPIAAIGLVATERRLPSDLDQILAAHPLLHAAEGHLYERAVMEAGEAVGRRVHVVEPKSIVIPATIDTLNRAIGAPWQKDHKWATVAAFTALGSRQS